MYTTSCGVLDSVRIHLALNNYEKTIIVNIDQVTACVKVSF